jgi:hypothetical protein
MLIGNNTADYGLTFFNGIDPPAGGYTIYLNKASGGPSIYCPANDTQLISITNQISVSTNLIKNNNGGNFADGTIAPFNYPYPAQTFPTVFDVSNDKPYSGSSTKYALKFPGGVGGAIYSEPSPFTMTVGVVYTFSFWYKQNNSTQSSFNFNNQGGSGDINGNFIAGITTGPSQTWQRFSWTFTNVINKVYFIISPMTNGSEVLMTEFTLTEGSMPGGPGLTTAENCFNWFAFQTDKIITNFNYEGIVTNGLVLNLDAGFRPSFATIPSNANSSTITPWYDISGNNNSGSLINGPTFSSANSGSIVFDGVDDYVNFTTSPSNVVTVSVWINLNNAGNFPIILAGNSNQYNSSAWDWSLFSYNETFYIRGNSGGYGDISTPSSTLVNVWTNWVLVRNDGTGTCRAYKNGTLFGTSGEIGSVNSSLYIGKVGQYYNGKISTTQIYNRALSAAEVLQNYNAQKGRFGL